MVVTLPGGVQIEHVSLEAVRRLLEPQAAPCLSLYLPTHRNVPDNTVDLPAFRHLVEALELGLSVAQPRHEIDRLLAPFRLLADDARFWRHTRDGLAVLASDGAARVFLLQRPVRPLALVTKRFHTMPLLRAAAALERFNVLAVTSRAGHVYEGAAWHDGAAGGIAGVTMARLDPVPLVPVPGHEATAALIRDDVVEAETFEPHRVQRGMGPAGLGSGSVVHGGADSKQHDVDADTEIFLRHVDEVVHEQVSNRSGLPLVLVAKGRLAAMFRGLARNPLLLDDHVDLDPHLLDATALAAAVTPLFVAARAARVARELAIFAQARDHSLAAGDLAAVARAAVAGQVATLLVEADRFEPGTLDRVTGAITGDGPPAGDLSRSGDLPAASGEDLLAAVAETVLLHGGTITTLAHEDMPTASGVAAIYRYA